MAERNISRPWSDEEDLLLKAGVAQYGENDNWKTIALSIPGRTNKACRKRWLHSLQPSIKKSVWTREEDEALIALYEKLGPKWSLIARSIEGRTDDACSKRYREALDPTLKKDEWTQEEDERLVQVYNRIGGKWGQVGAELNRSGLGCRNRWRLLERRATVQAAQQSLAGPSTQTPDFFPHIQNHSLNVSAPSVHWPPYYPPTAYPTFPTDNHTISPSFREPTPEALVIPDPNVAPFQPSSSSLSAALSDPPRPPPPLPPYSVYNTPELVIHDIPRDDKQPSLSPLSQCNGIPEMNDILMSLDDYQQPSTAAEQFNHLDNAISQSLPGPYDSPNALSMSHLSDFYSASPIFISSELSRETFGPPNSLQINFWKPRNVPDTAFEDSPRSVDNRSILNDDFSSASSTPFGFTSSLSPTSSPNPETLVELPNPEQPSLGSSFGSLLFSTNDSSQVTWNTGSTVRRSRKSTTARKTKVHVSKSPAAARLSSVLPLGNDPDLRPYACGRPSCWPAGEATSSSCFSTSGELLDHSKEHHMHEEPSEKPYRCALPGCGKTWKSINGLQYHLQISTVHFTSALFDRFSAQHPSTPDVNHSPLSVEAEAEDEEPERRHMCPQPGCYKAYRQPSGLRYHIKYGHPSDMPVQLSVVPPALERAIPTKAKKMRPKPAPVEGTVT